MRKSFLAVALLASLALAGCGKDPNVAKQEFVKSGDDYAAKGLWREATVEYRNAVQQDLQFGEARFKLAEAYMKLGEPKNAYGEYIRAADLLPGDIKAQLAAGSMLLLSQEFEDAGSRAERALLVDPRNADALVLKANSLAGLKNVEDAVREVEAAISQAPGQSSTYSTLATLRMISGDATAAEESYLKAVEADPKSRVAQLALANFYWVAKRYDEAEPHLKAALALDPKHLLVNRILASFYFQTKRPKEAEEHFKVVAAEMPDRSGQILLADYYSSIGRGDDARALLETVAGSTVAAASDAKLRLATMAAAKRDSAGAMKLIDEVLAKNKANVGGLILKSGLQARAGETTQAIASARAATEADPQSVEAQIALGLILKGIRETTPAIEAFKRALALSPQLALADIELGQLYLAAGRVDEAQEHAESAFRQLPDNVEARFLRARVLRVRGDLAAAEQELKTLSGRYADSVSLQVELGRIQLAKKNTPAARATFEGVLTKAPANVDALIELTAMDLRANDAVRARARLQAATAKSPENARLQTLMAQVYVTLRQYAAAERALRKVVGADPEDVDAAAMLADLHVRSGRTELALKEYQALAERQPGVAAPHILIGSILASENRRGEAKEAYRKALAINPAAPMAANNLAFLYAQDNERLDEALDLAQKARSAMPESAFSADTLGWVHYKRGNAGAAIAPLKEALERDPANAAFKYHLGLAYAKNGDLTEARVLLESALKANPEMAEAAEARSALARLSVLGS